LNLPSVKSEPINVIQNDFVPNLKNANDNEKLNYVQDKCPQPKNDDFISISSEEDKSLPPKLNLETTASVAKPLVNTVQQLSDEQSIVLVQKQLDNSTYNQTHEKTTQFVDEKNHFKISEISSPLVQNQKSFQTKSSDKNLQNKPIMLEDHANDEIFDLPDIILIDESEHSKPSKISKQNSTQNLSNYTSTKPKPVFNTDNAILENKFVKPIPFKYEMCKSDGQIVECIAHANSELFNGVKHILVKVNYYQTFNSEQKYVFKKFFPDDPTTAMVYLPFDDIVSDLKQKKVVNKSGHNNIENPALSVSKQNESGFVTQNLNHSTPNKKAIDNYEFPNISPIPQTTNQPAKVLEDKLASKIEKAVENIHFDTKNIKHSTPYKSFDKVPDIESTISRISAPTHQNQSNDHQNLQNKNLIRTAAGNTLKKNNLANHDDLPDLNFEDVENNNANKIMPGNISNIDDSSPTLNSTIAKLQHQVSINFNPNLSIFNECKISTSNVPPRTRQTAENLQNIPQKLIDEGYHLVCMPKGSFKVYLIVDNNEPDFIVNKLKMTGIDLLQKKLNIGDFTWIARPNSATDDTNDVALDFIVERKRFDDLAHSIIDGRFHEQKMRLNKTCLKHIFYLHEKASIPPNAHFYKRDTINPEAINQALTNTLICDGFYVKQTKGVDGTLIFLQSLTRELVRIYSSKNIYAIAYNEFHSLKSQTVFADLLNQPLSAQNQFLVNHQTMDRALNKTHTPSIKEMFAKSLTRIDGVGWNKALEIIKLYPTPKHLIEAYKKLSNEAEKHTLLTNITYGPYRKKIGPQVSKSVYTFFNLS